MESKKIKLEHDGYAIVRRPLLALQRLDRFYERNVAGTVSSPRELINALLDIPHVDAAVKLGSPGLAERAHSDLQPAKLESILVSLAKYLIRMATRCTPYSAFATVALGKIVEETPLSKPSTNCRLELDCGVLAHLAYRIQQKVRVHGKVGVKLNPTAYRVQNEIRYFDRQLAGDTYSFALAKISRTPHLDYLIDFLDKQPTSIDAVVSALRTFDDELSEEEVLGYIQELIQSGLIAVDADLRVTDTHPIVNYIKSLHRALPGAGIEKERELLEDVATALNPASECSVHEAVGRVESVEAVLAAAEIPIVPGRVVHVDTFSDECEFAVPAATLAALATTLERLHGLFPVWKNQKLTEFANSFEKRFGDQFVPLLAALDPETGVRYGHSSSIVPWTSKLALRSATRQRDGDAEAPLRALMAGVLASQKREIDLSEFPLFAHPGALPLAPSLSANVTFFRRHIDDANEENTLAHLHYFTSPGSTNLIARFAARHPSIAERMRVSVNRENEQHPDVILAEIVHTPQPRMGNVLARPQLREYEIIVSGEGAVEHSCQIRLTELLVGVIGGEVVLWCTRLQRQVIPRLTSAYNYGSQKNIGIFQFLCGISRQTHTVPNFRWPASFDSTAFLPRVVSGGIVVAAARWTIDKQKLAEIGRLGAGSKWSEISELLSDIGVPQHFVIEQGDQRLEIDRDNWLALSVFTSMTKKLSRIHLRESTARIGEPLFKGEQESWNSEIVIPLRISPAEHVLNTNVSSRIAASVKRSISAALKEDDERGWCYYKIYGGEQYLSGLLVRHIFPELEMAQADDLIEKWHFVRYADPDFHFRIRAYGRRGGADVHLQSIITRFVMPSLRTYQVSAVNTEVYIPELVRYSGETCLPIIESIFSVDSDYCAAVISVAEEESNDDWIWKGAMAGVVQYMDILESYGRGRRDFAKRQRDMFRSEMLLGPVAFDRLGQDYRGRRAYVESCVRGDFTMEPRILAALTRRGSRLKALFEELNKASIAEPTNATLEELMGSIVHMQCNRIFVTSSRPQEYVIWEYLDRAFRSVGARV